MAVIDANEKAIGVVGGGDRLAQLRRIDLISRLGGRVDVLPADETIGHLAVAEKQAAALAWS
jgi:hypothetical protein